MDETKVAATKLAAVWSGAFVGWSLSDWAALVAIITSLLAGVYTVLQVYVLWRDKIRGNK